MKKLFLYKSLLMIICLLGAAACGDGKKKEEALIGKSDEKTQLITVDTMEKTFIVLMTKNCPHFAVGASDLSFSNSIFSLC